MLELGLHTGQEPGVGRGAGRGASFLAWNPHFSAGLGKQKSAQQKAARQPAGTQLLEGVGPSLMRWQRLPPLLGWAPLAGKAFNLPEAAGPGLPEPGQQAGLGPRGQGGEKAAGKGRCQPNGN